MDTRETDRDALHELDFVKSGKNGAPKTLDAFFATWIEGDARHGTFDQEKQDKKVVELLKRAWGYEDGEDSPRGPDHADAWDRVLARAAKQSSNGGGRPARGREDFEGVLERARLESATGQPATALRDDDSFQRFLDRVSGNDGP
ncbi:MAG: hypothetical protein ACLFOY_07725 [Desulfatibacillaceae bacterium]